MNASETFRIFTHLLIALCVYFSSYAIAHKHNNSHVEAPSFFELGELIFQHVGDSETIPKGVITAIVQDSRGFLWIGTQFGLIRYDGYRFKRFGHSPEDSSSLPGNFVRALWAGRNGQVWVGTFSDGVSVFEPETEQFRHFKYDPATNNSLSNNNIRALIGDNQGNIFVATNDGLNYINSDTSEVARLDNIAGCDMPLKTTRMRSVLFEQPHTLWLGTQLGLCKITLPDNFSQIFTVNQMALTGQTYGEFNGKNVFRLFLAKDNSVWVGTTDDGAARLGSQMDVVQWVTHQPNDPESLSHHWVNGIAQPTADEIWLGTSGGGITVVDAVSASVKRHIRHEPLNEYSIPLDTMGAMLVDDSGVVWAGTWGGGLSRYNPKNKAFRKFVRGLDRQHTLTHEDVRGFVELNNGQIWVGTAQSGIDIVSPEFGVVGGFRPDPDNPKALSEGYVRVMRQTRDGSVWAGTTNKGLHRYDFSQQRFYRYTTSEGLPSIQIVTLHETPGDKLWVGTGEGVVLINTQTNQVEDISHFSGSELFTGKSILSFVYDHNDRLWVGTRNGLLVIFIGEEKVLEVSPEAGTTQSLSDNYINSLLLDSQKRLVVATPHGLDRLVSFNGRFAKFESLNTLVGRPVGTAGNLLEDAQGRIWNGYGWLDPNQGTWQNLARADDWDVGTMWTGSYIKLRDGTMLFGGTKGILLMRPSLWQNWQYQPKLVISELEVNNQAVPIPEKLVLPADTKSFSVEFAALDFTAPEHNQYAYKLEGFDEKWIYTDASKRRITYTRLSPGNYHLHIKGTNRKGKWSEHQIDLLIVQQPKWFETIWIKLLLFTVLAFGLYSFYRWRVKELKQQQAALDSLVQSRTENISMLGTIGQEITSTLHLGSVLERVYKHVNELMNADVFVVGILDAPSQRILCQLAIEQGEKLPPFEYALTDLRRPAVWCINNQSELVVNRVEELKHYVEYVAAPVSGANTESLIYLPLLIDKQVLGCITVQSFKQAAFNDNDVQMLRTIANYTAIALANAESVEKLEATFSQLKEAHNNLQQTQEQLVQQEKMAGLGRLVSGVAHEINTPLGISITASSHAMKELGECQGLFDSSKLTKNKLHSFLEVMSESLYLLESNLSRAAQLVKNFKQVAVDQSIEERGEINLGQYLEDTLMSLRPKWKHTEIVVETNFDDGIVLSTYPGAIAQVLTNLIENSVRHGFEEGKHAGKIEISLQYTASYIEWLFVDNGVGMSKETLAKVFDPFYTTRRSAGGTGLGMHIVYNIVTQKLHGEITCQSSHDQGCQFVIKLPSSNAKVD
ncbi:two-component regulator propeller domain-containing protein [Pseudoalteromonas umbrosa]|uniref:two-component regulator propeller domain-containing protein n=1 Tax=Pseudoalteromonas umbrosa TaxID=3048489 RepID=UPI0024C36DFA|nr:two-component regulator propeller domain-containing protein [Pseudoalteromonas sp. B95]MDK1287333.1 two-component regulator propeller domain-containing protein [Pseudoalteromonas sp. B95]